MHRLEAPGTTGFYNSDFNSKVKAITGGLIDQGYGFGFVHIKAVDDTGHDRNWPMKVRFLEVVDKLIAQLVRVLWENEKATGQRYVICCTGDHSTPIIFGDH